MRKRFCLLTAICVALFMAGMACAAEKGMAKEAGAQTLQLLPPQTDTQPFIQILAKRASTRTYSSQPLPMQTLSNLLWSAFGISRADSGKRTAPSANNKQEIDVYVAMEKGIYIYDAKANLLKLVAAGDHRAATGTQPYVKDAALNLVYVADMGKSGGKTDEDKLLYAAAATGFISENVYLYCASSGWPRLPCLVTAGACGDHEASANQKIILSQTVGYPKKNYKNIGGGLFIDKYLKIRGRALTGC